MRINENGVNYWRRRWHWRWWWWGFRLSFLILTAIMFFMWIYAPDPELQNILLIIFIVLLIVSIVGFVALYYLTKPKAPPPDRALPRERIREVRRARARQAGLLKYCIQCGKEIPGRSLYLSLIHI